MNKSLRIGISMLLVLVIASLVAPFLSHFDPAAVDANALLSSPSATHFFGTDSLGRDLFARVLYGGRVSLSIGLFSVLLSLLIGISFGALAGYCGGWVDSLIMRFVDIMFCFPTFFLMLSLSAVLESSVLNIILIIGLTGWMSSARLLRSEILSLKEREFILAERVLGAGKFRIIFFHLIPNAIHPVLVNATLAVASAILIEAGLSFLGLGVQPPTPSWGNILIESKSTLGFAWWIMVFPGIMIMLTILAIHLIAQGVKAERGFVRG